jgi:hypothetical protein
VTKLEIKYAAIGFAALTFADVAFAATAGATTARARADALADGWTAQSASDLRGSGGYSSLADYTRSIEGIPCDMNCTREKAMQQSLPRHF